MPLYEYRCSKCGKKFELIRKFSDALLTIHEGCGGQVEQLISAPAFHLKGHGWYATDYTKQTKTSENSDTKSEAKPEGKPEATEGKLDGSSDSKADAKPAAPAPKTDSQPSPATKTS